MRKAQSYKQSDSDSSISLDAEQFRRLYEKQLKKEEVKKSQRQNQERQELRRLPINQIQQQDRNGASFMRRIRTRHADNERERSREKQCKQSISWHLYQQAGPIDYMSSLSQRLRILPIFKKKDQILRKIILNQIVLVTGDTGCGKSTQVPRLIYEYLKKIGSNDKIICVQPRRLAVTSLKSAVQNQLSDRQRVVGYQIGQKAQFNSNSKIVFMTNGIFLQRLIHDSSFLNEYPFVILDEVHQRDIDTDFILTALKRVIRQFPKVRIVLMSATIDNQLFRYYFASDHIDSFMTQQNFYKQIIEFQEYQKARQEQNSNEEGFCRKVDSDQEQERKRQIYDNVALKFLQSKFPCPAININQPSNFRRTEYYLDTIEQFIKLDYLKKWGSIIWDYRHPNTYKQLFQMAWVILSQIKHNSRNKNDFSAQAVLIFLPGLNQIQNLSEQIFKFFGGRQKTSDYFEIIHVHSTIMTDKVEERINTPNKRQIKVIIATNIAQSSITVKGVKYIIDFCLTKQIRYDMKSRMQNLQLVWSSKASCKQRAGRTGRVCDGYIFRLVQQKFYTDKFQDYSQPQIKRSSLDKLILRIKMMHENDKNDLFKDPPQVLGTCIQPPKLQSIQSAINSLKFCGGLEQRGDQFFITDLGKLYVEIPIDITYTKLLVTSILFGTFNDILILVSILSQNKSPIHKRQIQNNYLKYFDQMANYQYCDFLALINLFKSEEQFRNDLRQIKQEQRTHRDNANDRQYVRDQQKKRDRLPFSIYTQTKNTINDITRRLQRKWFNLSELSSYLEFREGSEVRGFSRKCKEQKTSRSKYQDYFMRFKLTIAFGFIDKLILIKPPMYQTKQQKRIKDMKRYNISNDNTIVLLNSSVITKPSNNNRQAQQKFIRHWKEVFKKSLNINIKNISLGSGLNYLHFQDQIDLNKLVFIKHMYSSSKRRSGCVLDKEQDSKSSQNNQRHQTKGESNRPAPYEPSSSSSSSILTTKQILQCLGDLDHMQQGIAVTLFQQNRITIDYHSLNRVNNLNQDAGHKYLLSNSFMLQNKNSLSCRYSSALNIFSLNSKRNPNTILHVLLNLLFYPFVKLKANRKNSAYEHLALRKKYSIRIPYNLTSDEIQQANFIRELIKQFLEFKRKMNSQTCNQFYTLIKNFINKKRKDVVNEGEQEIWQNQFLRQLKQGKVKESSELNLMNLQLKQKTNFNKIQHNIVEENNQITLRNSGEQNVMSLSQLRQKVRKDLRSFQTRNFMNPIQLPKISVQDSYFLRPRFQSAERFKRRIQIYLNWKINKFSQVQQLKKYAQDNDTYLCCGYINEENNECCGTPLCKLKRIGALNDQETFRDLFQSITNNIIESAQQNSEIDDFLYGQNFQQQYDRVCCKNNHEIGIRLKGQTKIKIIILKQFAIKYPDFPYSPIRQVEFSCLDIKDWISEQKSALMRKQKKQLSTSCYLCAIKISTFKELKNHIQDPYHMKSIQKFKKSINATKLELQINCKEEQHNQDCQAQSLLEKKQSNLLKPADNNAIQIQY